MFKQGRKKSPLRAILNVLFLLLCKFDIWEYLQLCNSTASPPQEYSYFKTTAPKALKSKHQSLMDTQIEDEAWYALVFNLLLNHRRLIVQKIGNRTFEKLYCVLKE